MAQKEILGWHTPIQLTLVVSVGWLIWQTSDFRRSVISEFNEVKAQNVSIINTQSKQDLAITTLKERVDKIDAAGSELAKHTAEDLSRLREQVNGFLYGVRATKPNEGK